MRTDYKFFLQRVVDLQTQAAALHHEISSIRSQLDYTYRSKVNDPELGLLNEIVDVCCKEFPIPSKLALFSKIRTAKISECRQTAMALAYEHTDLALHPISQYFMRDANQTIIYAAEMVKNKVSVDKVYAQKYHKCSQAIQAFKETWKKND